MEAKDNKDFTEKDLQIAQIKLDCLKLAGKHTFSFEDLINQSKKLMALINLL